MARQFSLNLHPVAIMRLTAFGTLAVFIGVYIYLAFSPDVTFVAEQSRNYNARVVQQETAAGGVFLRVATLKEPTVQQQPGAAVLPTGQGVTAPITYIPSELGKRDLTRVED